MINENYPQIDLSQWQQVGEEGNGKTYVNPAAPGKILKVNNGRLSTFDAVKHEFDVSKAVEALGLSVPHVNEIVRVGEAYATISQFVKDKKSLSRICHDEPERTEEMARLLCQKGKELFATPCNTGCFPNRKEQVLWAIDHADFVSKKNRRIIRAFAESIPEKTTCVHGDFQTEVDLKGKANKDVPGAKYVNLPIDASGNAAANATEEEMKKVTGRKKFEVKKVIMFAAFNEKAKAIAKGMYPTLLFDQDCQLQFARFLRLVVDTENGAILYHCTQGKDRTGIASALLLAALGASRETIVSDFDATNKVYEKDVRKYSRRVRFWGGKEEEVAVVKAFLGANTENFVKALDTVDQQYGSIEAYLKGPMGLTDDDIRILRKRYLSPTNNYQTYA